MNATVQPVLDVRGAGTRAFGRRILQDIDLRIAAGETVALCGAAGAGKSALVDLLYGHASLDAGTVALHGRRCDPPLPFAALRAGMALVPQRLCNIPFRSAAGNIRTGDVGRPGPFSMQRVLALLPALESVLAQPCGLLPWAAQCEVALARALLSNPSLVLVDALSHARWSELPSSVLFALRTLARQGTAVLVTTRHRGVAARLGDHVVHLSGGRIAACTVHAVTPSAA